MLHLKTNLASFKKVIEKLIYLTITRPDITFVVSHNLISLHVAIKMLKGKVFYKWDIMHLYSYMIIAIIVGQIVPTTRSITG